MSNLIIYVDNSEIRPGQYEALNAAITELAQFIQVNEPQLIAYHVYFDQSHSRMMVLHIHPNAESLEFHLRVAGPRFSRFAEFVKMVSIDLYGEPGEFVTQQLQQKAETLGGGVVRLHSLHAGFARFPA